MAWFWTDDLAQLAIDAGMVERSEVQAWIARPHGVAASEGTEPLDLVAQLLGVDDRAGAA